VPNGVRIDPATTVQLGPMAWASIVDALPRTLRVRVRSQSDEYQRFVEAVIWVAWVDVRWVQLRSDCGTWPSVYSRFLRWNRRRLWDVVALHIGEEAGAHLLRLARETRQMRPQLPLRGRAPSKSHPAKANTHQR